MRRCLLLCGFLLAAHGSARSEQPARDAYGLTAYRPQQGVGYTTFARTAVPDHLEEDPLFGPGIRVNQADEEDFAVEDDLIEIVVAQPEIDATLVLKRSHSDLSVWRTRDKRARRELAFTRGRSTQLAFEEGEQMSLWVEWTGAASEFPVLSLHALGSDVVVDRIVFHSFAGLVVALGGEGQVPQIPVHTDHGTFQVATSLYAAGWDVLMTDEDRVAADGSGRVYNEVVNAIENRSVRELAIFGYSHGGGSTYDLRPMRAPECKPRRDRRFLDSVHILRRRYPQPGCRLSTGGTTAADERLPRQPLPEEWPLLGRISAVGVPDRRPGGRIHTAAHRAARRRRGVGQRSGPL